MFSAGDVIALLPRGERPVFHSEADFQQALRMLSGWRAVRLVDGGRVQDAARAIRPERGLASRATCGSQALGEWTCDPRGGRTRVGHHRHGDGGNWRRGLVPNSCSPRLMV